MKIIKSLKLLFICFLSNAYAQEAQSIFGSYTKPLILEKLEDYQIKGEINEELWFYLDSSLRYSITPLDVIPFAYTGYAGLHFGFLTDFGRAKNLSHAPIVAISPSDDPPIRLVAENLKEFFFLVYYAQDATFLVYPFENEEAFQEKQKEKFNENSDQNYLKKLGSALSILYKELNVPRIENGFVATISNNIIERKKKVSHTTKDGLGIVFDNEEPITEFKYTKDVNEIQGFLKTANRNSRMVFYRNATIMYILSEGFDEEIKNLIMEYLIKDGLIREAEMLNKYY